MQKIIKNDLSEIRYFEDNVNVIDWIDLTQYRLMTESEVLKHETNPYTDYHVWDENLLEWVDNRTPEQLAEFNRKNMHDLSRIEFKYKLHKAGKLEEVEQFIKTTDNFLLQLAYNEAQFFSRTDHLLSQALVDLGWTEVQVDEIWTS